jgi:hypothetical protein
VTRLKKVLGMVAMLVMAAALLAPTASAELVCRERAGGELVCVDVDLVLEADVEAGEGGEGGSTGDGGDGGDGDGGTGGDGHGGEAESGEGGEGGEGADSGNAGDGGASGNAGRGGRGGDADVEGEVEAVD